ncbi:sensor histidine kinase [Gracilibacillus sp. S3-1-1]|uniref:Sensor histidine kinase n=1 Tax=Gracilibacillus pellucidus TaxID=3095368 RepID=A0ACC6M4T8_9BACI|nr:sensor histidine kinase [Gracilibacillus sp. S3-1-1]MDX8045842.1 sensor histidine kinase [Gracilibacillus sp. S3-1-1]
MLAKKRTEVVDLLIKMYENSSEAIFFLDHTGSVLALNPAAEQIINPTILETIKHHGNSSICSFCRGYTNQEQLMTCSSCYVKNPEGDFSSFQVYLETRDKGTVPYAASYHAIDEENDVYVFMLRDLSVQYKTQEDYYQNKMMKKVIEAQESERKRISRELHDSVLQELISTLVDMRVTKYMKDEQEIQEQLKRTEGSMNRLIEDIRNISVFLRPASLDDLGLEAAFRSHMKWIQQHYGTVIQFHSTLQQQRYPADIETAVYRIGQEAIFNAVKYAKVTEILVMLTEKKGQLELMVKDEGEGFNVSKPDIKGSGIGLYGMKERAELINGNLRIHSDQGSGTTVYLTLPVLKERDESFR